MQFKLHVSHFAFALIGVVSVASVQSFAQSKSAPMKMSPVHQKMSEGSMKMNARMMKPMSMVMSGNTDKDFAMMMAEHHMSGIDMAKIELKYGKNAALKKIASSIVASQTQERAHLLSLAKSIR